MSLKFLLISCCLHLGLLLAWVYLRAPKSAEKDLLRVVEIASLPQSPSSANTPKKRAGAQAPTQPKSRRAGGLTLSDLGIQWAGKGVPIPAEAGNGSDKNGKGFAYGSGGNDVLGQIAGSVTYRELYERIDEVLVYPDEFVETGIEGTVSAWLIFSAQGTWLRGRSRFHASSPYLRVYIIQVLRRAFAETLPATYFKQGLELKLQCSFYFQLKRNRYEMEEPPVDAKAIPMYALGNRFSFVRAAGEFGQWKLGPLSGFAVAPSIGVDPGWFVDRFEDATSNKAKGDPLEKYRHDPEWAG